MAIRRRLSALEEIEEASRQLKRYGRLPPSTVSAGMMVLSVAMITVGVVGTALIMKFQVPIGLWVGAGAVGAALGYFVVRAVANDSSSFQDRLLELVRVYLKQDGTDAAGQVAETICASPAALAEWLEMERVIQRGDLARLVA